nr:hypothetical protein [Candidatus Sigynarchaeota archaeon]
MSMNPHIERNVALVRERMLQQLDSSLDKGAHYIDQELDSPKYLLIKPIIQGFYSLFARPDINSGSKGNLQVCIDAGREVVTNPSTNLEQIINKYFPKYLKNDQTAKYCNKFHKNY